MIRGLLRLVAFSGLMLAGPGVAALLPGIAPDVPAAGETGIADPPRIDPSAAAPAEDSETASAERPLAGADSPYLRYLRRLATQPTPQQEAAFVRDLFRESGHDAGPTDEWATYDENYTVSYGHRLGDVDGDGHDDVGLDQYCLRYDPCYHEWPWIDELDVPQLLDDIVNGRNCGWAHRFVAISGADGHELWSRPLDPPHAVYLLGCQEEFVLGSVPVPGGGPGVLVYRHSIYDPLFFTTNRLYEHEVYALDAHGRVAWSYTLTGNKTELYDGFGRWVVKASNSLVLPLLQVPPTEGVRLVAPETKPSLLLQIISYTATYHDTAVDLEDVGIEGAMPLLASYQPDEHLVRIDLERGRPDWDRPTFSPQLTKSRVPSLLVDPPPFPRYGHPFDDFDYEYDTPRYKQANRWTRETCCYDATGDGVPDALYTLLEWSAFPAANLDGPYFLAAHVVLYDGATGAFLYDVVVEPGLRLRGADVLWPMPENLRLWPQALGDANGDGASDYLLHTWIQGSESRHVLSARSGRDGSELWNLTNARDLRSIVIGDADRDTANDLLVYDWYEDGVTLERVPLRVLSGRDGHTVWQTSALLAPADYGALLDAYRASGLADLDRDGVAEVPVDDPLFLEDLTPVHRIAFLSGRDGAPLLGTTTVGALAAVARAPDIDGDGTDEFALVSGEVNDVWLTVYDGRTGEPQWSRRLAAPKLAYYYSAVPRIALLGLGPAGTPGSAFYLDFHLRVVTTRSSLCIDFEDGLYRCTFQITNVHPRAAILAGTDGTSAWTQPGVPDQSVGLLSGATPAAQSYQRLAQPPAGGPHASEWAAYVGVPAVAFLASSLGAFALARRRKGP